MSQAESAQFSRASGVLMHITSLPGDHGIGDLGKGAYDFVNFLASARQRLWQILPLMPTGAGDSPYAALSAFAGNPLVISLEKLAGEGLLQHDDLSSLPSFHIGKVDYDFVRQHKVPLLRRAFERFSDGHHRRRQGEFEDFCWRHSYWLNDFALFMALRNERHGAPWWQWGSELVSRQPEALESARSSLANEIRFHEFLQFVFFSQWFELKAYANKRNVKIIGDIPIFVANDSADVWAQQEIFALDAHGHPTVVAGVPPDYFSATGQRWGNPHYRWDVLADMGYKWWIDRLREMLAAVDVVRIDHFRGFEAYWEIPSHNPTAEHGRWVKGPGEALFHAVERAMGKKLPIIVEDLGTVTPEVEALRDKLGYPGMKILQFAFDGGPDNPYLPHNFPRNCVVYTGTHDNDVTSAWFSRLSEHERSAMRRYLGCDGTDISWSLIRLAWRSVANIAIAPLQDVLNLGSEARINMPGRPHGNWAWRCAPNLLTENHAARLRELTEVYGRL